MIGRNAGNRIQINHSRVVGPLARTTRAVRVGNFYPRGILQSQVPSGSPSIYT
jgi:hypothetical protein